MYVVEYCTCLPFILYLCHLYWDLLVHLTFTLPKTVVRTQVFWLRLAIFLPKVLELCAGTSQVGELNVPKLVDKYLQACFKPTKRTATGQLHTFIPTTLVLCYTVEQS